MKEGLSYKAFAGLIGVNRATLYSWEEAHPEFKEAKEIGESASELWWETQGRDGVWGITEYDEKGKPTLKKSLNTGVWAMNMRNRFAWIDKQPDESDKAPVPPPQLTPEQFNEYVERQIAARKRK